MSQEGGTEVRRKEREAVRETSQTCESRPNTGRRGAQKGRASPRHSARQLKYEVKRGATWTLTHRQTGKKADGQEGRQADMGAARHGDE